MTGCAVRPLDKPQGALEAVVAASSHNASTHTYASWEVSEYLAAIWVSMASFPACEHLMRLNSWPFSMTEN